MMHGKNYFGQSWKKLEFYEQLFNLLQKEMHNLVKQKTWLNDHLKPGQLICLMLDEETVLTEKCGVLGFFVSDLLPRKLIRQKDQFSQEVKTERYICKPMKGSLAYLLVKKIPWPDETCWYRTMALPSESFVMKM